jgi:hypothetical protein
MMTKTLYVTKAVFPVAEFVIRFLTTTKVSAEIIRAVRKHRFAPKTFLPYRNTESSSVRRCNVRAMDRSIKRPRKRKAVNPSSLPQAVPITSINQYS